MPTFTCIDKCRNREGYLHAHACMEDVVYHFGLGKLVGPPLHKMFTKDVAQQWQHLNTGAVKSLLHRGHPGP